jgi:hypothetical protein
LTAALDRIPQLVSKETADIVSQVVEEAARVGDTRTMRAAAVAAGEIYSRIGAKSLAQRKWHEAGEAAFAMAETPDEYTEARSLLRRVEPPLFLSTLVSADAAYFASLAAEQDAQKGWIVAAIDDLCSLPNALRSGIEAEGLASLAHALSRTIWKLCPDRDDRDFEGKLRELAKLIDASVSPDLAFLDNEQKTSEVRMDLATLSALYGDKSLAVARWEVIMG